MADQKECELKRSWPFFSIIKALLADFHAKLSLGHPIYLHVSVGLGVNYPE
jgi:hypothetical protein